MKKTVLCFALLSLLALGGQAVAEICAIDAVPAATLLLPYFEVDLNDPNALTTLFSVNNASAAPQVVHVVLWTDLSVPTLDFDVYLTGYDVQTFNLRDLFEDGDLPQTGPAVKAAGPKSLNNNTGNPELNLATCTKFPIGDLDAARLTHLRLIHTGQESPIFDACGGKDFGDNIARGYITVDVVNECSLLFPGDTGYFAPGGAGIASNNNVIWGDYFYVDQANAFAQGETLVHVEACDDDGPSVGEGENCPFGNPSYTFYGRYLTPTFSGVDQREPLAQTWATRYLTSDTAFTGGTDLVVWRDSKVDQQPFPCPAGAGNPFWFPLGQGPVMVWDEMEDAVDVCFGEDDVSPAIGGAQACFPCEAARYNVEASGVPFGASINPPFPFGWLMADLGTTVAGTPFPGRAQSYMTTVMSALGLFSVGFDAIHLDDLCDLNTGP